jgi:hypothetical protein
MAKSKSTKEQTTKDQVTRTSLKPGVKTVENFTYKKNEGKILHFIRQNPLMNFTCIIIIIKSLIILRG